MDTILQAAEILHRAERALQELLAKAATSGRYDELMRLGDLAREVATLVTKAGDLARTESPTDVATNALHSAKSVSDTSGRRPLERTGLRKGSYPKFLRDGETIIKLGWSKTAKAEYEHKSPKPVLMHLVATLAKKLSATKKRFAMDEVLPLRDTGTGSDVPAYQAYLCLAWLRAVGIVTQHGRQGYTLTKKNAVDVRVEEYWRQLPTR